MRLRPWLVGVAVGVGGLALLGAWPPLRGGLLDLGRLLAAGDLPGVREHLRRCGPWAPIIAFGLIQLQAVAAPLPAFPVIYAMAWAGDLGTSSPGALVAGTLGITGLAAGAAWLGARRRARRELAARAADRGR